MCPKFESLNAVSTLEDSLADPSPLPPQTTTVGDWLDKAVGSHESPSQISALPLSPDPEAAAPTSDRAAKLLPVVIICFV